MDYNKIYENLISRSKNRLLTEYKEKHHIIPRCMGGSDEKENLTYLTAEEHYLAHQLLVKIFPKNYSLIKAATMMSVDRKNNKLYGWIRKRFAEAMSISQTGERNSQYGSFWITNGIEEKKIKGDIPEGWTKCRLSKVLKNEEKIKAKLIVEEKRKLKIATLRQLHDIYIVEGFEGVVKIGYKYSKQNLVMRFANLLPEFIPQNGKPRKKNSNLG